MRILWITPKWPLPVDDGARLATRALLRHLPGVDLLALAGQDETCDEAAARAELRLTGRVHVLRRAAGGRGARRYLRHLADLVARPDLPVTVARYASGPLQAAFHGLLASGDYGAIVFDGLHGAALLAPAGRFRRPAGVAVVYRAHNVETQLWEQAAARGGWLALSRPALARQARLMRDFEASVAAAADLVAPVAREDLELLRPLAGHDRFRWTPIGLDFSVPPWPPAAGQRLLFVGRLDWPPNRDGLRWFLTEVWPRVTAPEVSLTVAGSGDGGWLEAYRQLPRLELAGRVPDVSPLYRDCAAAIVPVFYGSGTRLKAIEPARFGRAVISTTAGAAGSTLEPGDYLPADSAAAWLAAVQSLDATHLAAVAARAREKLRAAFDETAVAGNFLAALLRLRPRRP